MASTPSMAAVRDRPNPFAVRKDASRPRLPVCRCPLPRKARHAQLNGVQTHSGDFELTTGELRAVAGYAVACAEPALVIFQKDHPDDPRPAAALQAARVFVEGAPRSRLRRLDGMLRDPAPAPTVVDDPGPSFHGTRADLRPGDLLPPRSRSNYGSRRQANHIYFTATREGAPLAPRSPTARDRDGSTGSSQSAPSKTIPTSPTSASPATRPGPTGPPSRCGSSRRSPAGNRHRSDRRPTAAPKGPHLPPRDGRHHFTNRGIVVA